MKRVALEKVAKIDRTVASDEDCQIMPYVGLEHLEKDAGHFSTSFVPNPESVLATKFRFTSKHVLYGKLRPYLNKVVMPNFDGVCTTEILPILPCEDELDRTFLWGYLLTPEFVSWASLIVSGANLPRLSPRDLAKHEIPLPPLPEQQRIAGILARADRLRQLRRYALQLSEGYLQAVFLQMFGDGRDLMSVKFEKLLLDNPKNGLYLPSEKYGTGTPIIRINNFYDGVLGNSQTFKRVRASTKEVKEFQVANGEILINRVNSIEYLGKCAYVQGIKEDTIFESNMMRIRVDTTQVKPIYLVKYLLTPQAYSQILRRGKKAVNQASINQTDVKSLLIPLPPLEQQKEFAKIVQQFERLRAQQHEAARQADHLFTTLLHRAFRGEL